MVNSFIHNAEDKPLPKAEKKASAARLSLAHSSQGSNIWTGFNIVRATIELLN